MKRRALRRILPFLLSLIIVLAAVGCGQEAPARPRVLLIGFDGLSWDLLGAMIKAGEAPNFARLQQEGAWGVLEDNQPRYPGAFWASVATGRPAEDHAILKPIQFDVETGELRLPSRTVSTLWEITTRYQRPSGVLGWPHSAPVDEAVQTVVDDLAFYRGMGLAVPFPGATLKAPPFKAIKSPYVGEPPAGPNVAARIEAASLSQFPPMAEDAWARLDVLAVFFDGANSARHYSGAAQALDPKVRWPRFGKPARKHIRHIDRVLGDLLALADEQTLVMVVGCDPQFRAGRNEEGDFASPVRGMVGLLGPMIVKGRNFEGGGALDFVPLALTHLGIPHSEQMPGSPFLAAWSAKPPKLPPVATHDIFIRRPYPRDGRINDPDALARIRSLKKLVRSGAALINERNAYTLELLASGSLRGAWSEAAIDLEAHPDNPVSLYVQGEILLHRRDGAPAAQRFKQAARILTDRPTTDSGRALRVAVGIALAELNLDGGQAAEAAAHLRPVVEICDECTGAVTMLARCHQRLGHAERAVTIVENALRRWPNDTQLLLTLGRMRLENGNADGAREAFRAVLAAKNGDHLAEAYLGLGRIALQGNETDKAIRHFAKVTELTPSLPDGWFYLAEARQRAGRNDEAEQALLAGLRLAPGDTRAWMLWRRIQIENGQPMKARRLLQAAMESVAGNRLAF